MTSMFDSSDSSSTHSTTSGFSLNLDTGNEKTKESVFSKSYSDKNSCAKDYDVPFFTVARYRNPKSPTTYEIAAGSSIERSESAKEFRESLEYLEAINTNGRYSRESPCNEPSSVCNYSLDDSLGISREWLGKSFDMHYSRPIKGTIVTSRSDTLIAAADDKNQRNVPCIEVMVSDKFKHTDNSSEVPNETNQMVKSQTFNQTIVRGYINFFENSTPKTRGGGDPGAKKCAVSRRASTPLSKSENYNKDHFFYSSINKRNNSLTEVTPKTTVSKKSPHEKGESAVTFDKSVPDNVKSKKKAAYEDARVTDAAEKLSDVPASAQPLLLQQEIKDKDSSGNRDTVHRVDKLSEKESEYIMEVNKKIADSHERQLVPLKEDLADWLSKLLDEKLTSENLTSSLETGILLCRLATLISRKAQEARDKSLSTLEVPSLPYKTWDHARKETFFARDNISNFLRFCGRLGVHSNLLFETEDLVSGSGVRRVVLCLLEVGRLAHMWWDLEPPGLVKLERDLHKKDDLGQSMLPKEPEVITTPPTLSDDSKKVCLKKPQASIKPPLAVKPIVPPKPQSIKRAVLNMSKRPTNFTISKSYGRSWTTIGPTAGTRAVTPANTYKTRLPVAKTPITSGKTSPNTTPTTPTQSRRYAYMVSIEGSSMNYISSRIMKTTRSVSSKSRVPDAYKAHSICSKWVNESKSPDEESKMSQLNLDSQVNKIADQTEGFCSCYEKRCEKHHIRKISDGKYNIHGKYVYVRLLKGKHVMVRVGGGWDTLEHYLIRHDPKQGKVCKTNSSSPYLQGKSKHRLEASSTTSLDRLHLGVSDKKKTKCNHDSGSLKTSPEGGCPTLVDRDHSRVTENSGNITVDTKVETEVCESGNCEISVEKTIVQESVMCEISELKNVDLVDKSLEELQSAEKEIWPCDLSAPVGEDGNFQSSSFSLGSLMIASNHSLDLI